VYLKNNPNEWSHLSPEHEHDTLSVSPVSTLVNSFGSNSSKRLSISQDPKLVREVKALASVSDHPNIVRYYNAWIEDDDTVFESSDSDDSDSDEEEEAHVAILYIQMELYSSYTLRDYLDGRTEIDRESNLRIFKQLVEAVVHIHSRQVIHLDIKPENIFIKDHNVHLGDFGLAKDSMEPNLQEPIFGTVFYTPPEKQSSSKYDIYSLGIILFELFVLFQTRMERANILTLLTTKNEIPALMKQLYPDVASLVSQLISIQSMKRLSAMEIKKHLIFHSSLSAGGRIQRTEANIFELNFEKAIKKRNSLPEFDSLSIELKATNPSPRSAHSLLVPKPFQRQLEKLSAKTPTFNKRSQSLAEQPNLNSQTEKEVAEVVIPTRKVSSLPNAQPKNEDFSKIRPEMYVQKNNQRNLKVDATLLKSSQPVMNRSIQKAMPMT
jgi:serine/threonine protein kinase